MPLPGYAPELKRSRRCGPTSKGVELVKLAGETAHDLIAAAECGVQPIRGTPYLACSFLRHCGLSPWSPVSWSTRPAWQPNLR
jgi:hypothetical protein